MFKSLRLALAAVALVAAAPLAASAHDYQVGALKIGHPWSRPNPSGAPTAAGYLSITNTGRTPDRLLGGASPAATTIEVHEMSMAGGIMRMRPVAGGLAIAAGQTVKLEPGGYHLMIIGPKRAFKVGDHIPVTLKFERAGRVKVDFDVEATAPASAPSMSGMGGMQGMAGMNH
jgi:copper(I)-binding protein